MRHLNVPQHWIRVSSCRPKAWSICEQNPWWVKYISSPLKNRCRRLIFFLHFILIFPHYKLFWRDLGYRLADIQGFTGCHYQIGPICQWQINVYLYPGQERLITIIEIIRLAFLDEYRPLWRTCTFIMFIVRGRSKIVWWTPMFSWRFTICSKLVWP